MSLKDEEEEMRPESVDKYMIPASGNHFGILLSADFYWTELRVLNVHL